MFWSRHLRFDSYSRDGSSRSQKSGNARFWSPKSGLALFWSGKSGHAKILSRKCGHESGTSTPGQRECERERDRGTQLSIDVLWQSIRSRYHKFIKSGI